MQKADDRRDNQTHPWPLRGSASGFESRPRHSKIAQRGLEGGLIMLESGKVKFYDRTKGYGFILRPGKKDLFVHHSGVLGEKPKVLYPGQTVTYEFRPTDRGDEAFNVTVTEPSTKSGDGWSPPAQDYGAEKPEPREVRRKPIHSDMGEV